MSPIDVLYGLGLALAGAALVLVSLVVRRRLLQCRGGTFECSLRRGGDMAAKGWQFGVARYRGESVEWFRVFSLSPRPARVLVRRTLEVVGRRQPEGTEVFAVVPEAMVLVCTDAQRPVEFAMTHDAVMGFLSWLESAPPGQHLVA